MLVGSVELAREATASCIGAPTCRQSVAIYLRRLVVHGASIIPIAVKDVLINGLALLGVEHTIELLGQPIECLFDCDPYACSGGLFLSPVENDLVPLQGCKK